MKKQPKYTGVNIQWPISSLILSGEKTIETRTYPIPQSYVGCEMVLIETPGPNGNFKARIVAIVKFGKSFKYKSKKHFYKDMQYHKVSPDSPWAWNEKPKWGWPIEVVKKLKVPVTFARKKGIRYTKDVSLS
jgi:hypothetical protein